MKLNPSLYPPKAISSAKQISSTIVDLFRRKTDLVEKTANFVSKLTVFLVAGAGFEPHDLRVIPKGPLAVPEKTSYALRIYFFDRCANPCSLHLPPAALTSVAQRAPLVGLITRI